MNAERRLGRAADFDTEQDLRLTWLEWELGRQPGSTFFGRAQEGCR